MTTLTLSPVGRRALPRERLPHTRTVGTGMIKRIHSYLEHRNKRHALRRGGAENKLVAPYEGRRWCDSTERELIGNVMNRHGYL
jgi:hypothetical protein